MKLESNKKMEEINKKTETINSLLSKINIAPNSNILLDDIMQILDINNHEIFIKCIKKWLKEQLNKDNNITLDI